MKLYEQLAGNAFLVERWDITQEMIDKVKGIDSCDVDVIQSNSWDQYYYDVAVAAACHSKCLSRSIGAVLVKDKTIDGFDPENVVTIMSSPLSGTIVPGASGRTEVQGIGDQSYPMGWFTRTVWKWAMAGYSSCKSLYRPITPPP